MPRSRTRASNGAGGTHSGPDTPSLVRPIPADVGVPPSSSCPDTPDRPQLELPQSWLQTHPIYRGASVAKFAARPECMLRMCLLHFRQSGVSGGLRPLHDISRVVGKREARRRRPPLPRVAWVTRASSALGIFSSSRKSVMNLAGGGSTGGAARGRIACPPQDRRCRGSLSERKAHCELKRRKPHQHKNSPLNDTTMYPCVRMHGRTSKLHISNQASPRILVSSVAHDVDASSATNPCGPVFCGDETALECGSLRTSTHANFWIKTSTMVRKLLLFSTPARDEACVGAE